MMNVTSFVLKEDQVLYNLANIVNSMQNGFKDCRDYTFKVIKEIELDIYG